MIVLIADDLGPIPETIRSRCQLVPFRRLSERAIRDVVDVRAPELADESGPSLARVAAGRLDRLERVLDPASRDRREALLEQARAPYRDRALRPADAAATIVANAQARAAEAREIEEATIAELDLSPRDAEQRVQRAARGAEREELFAQFEELAAWYRDLVAVAVGAESAAIHLDKLGAAACRRDPRADSRGRAGRRGGPRALAELEEFNLAPQIALEALFVRITARAGRVGIQNKKVKSTPGFLS